MGFDGVVGMVVMGGWLDFMILEVFSNLNDSTMPVAAGLGQGNTAAPFPC